MRIQIQPPIGQCVWLRGRHGTRHTNHFNRIFIIRIMRTRTELSWPTERWRERESCGIRMKVLTDLRAHEKAWINFGERQRKTLKIEFKKKIREEEKSYVVCSQHHDATSFTYEHRAHYLLTRQTRRISAYFCFVFFYNGKWWPRTNIVRDLLMLSVDFGDCHRHAHIHVEIDAKH